MLPMNQSIEPIVSELKLITKILIISNAGQIEVELGKLASTDERKKMWTLIDGKNMAKDIARLLKVSERGVNHFLKRATDAGFIDNPPRRPATRRLDYVPPSWLDLVEGIQEAGQGEHKPEATLSPPASNGEPREPNTEGVAPNGGSTAPS